MPEASYAIVWNPRSALARDADLAVDLLTQHLETTARHLEAIAPDVDAEPSAVNAAAG